jgi:hypothetical protein
MKINEILESIELEPHEVRELFMEIAKEIIWLLNSQSVVDNLRQRRNKL